MSQKSLDVLISPEQVQYEEALVETSHDESLWLDYAEAFSNDFEKSVFILDRAVSELPASILLWNTYLSLPWTTDQRDTLLQLYQRALSALGSTPALWYKYIDYLLEDPNHIDHSLAMSALDMALFHLHPSQHHHIWPKYLDLADNLANRHSAHIYYRYFDVARLLTNEALRSHEECVLNVLQYGEVHKAIELYDRVRSSKPSKSNAVQKFVLDFMDLLLQDSCFDNQAYFENIADEAIRDYPSMKSKIYQKVGALCSAKGNFKKARHFYNAAIQYASLTDFAYAFDSVTNWEENQLERLYVSNQTEELQLRLLQYRKLLKDRALILNDILIRDMPHCIDVWLDRVEIFNSLANQGEAINTYVRAIRCINPLAAYSRHGFTLVDVWTKYADIYIAQNDLVTANHIFNRGTKSQFGTVDELAKLYISWTEMILSVSDDDALKHIESILFVESTHSSANDSDSSKRSVHELVQRSSLLWSFYIDLLKSMMDGSENENQILKKLINAFEKMLDLSIINLQMVIDHVDFLVGRSELKQASIACETAISKFTSPEAQYHIWVRYLKLVLDNEINVEVIREKLDRCLSSEISGYNAHTVIQLYSDFELKKGNLQNAVTVLRKGIEYLTKAYLEMDYPKTKLNKIADDKFLLYLNVSRLILRNLKEKETYRKILSDGIQDPHLPLARTVELGQEFVDFEIEDGEYSRARCLFEYLVTLGHPDSLVLCEVWDKWEKFEIDFGSEESIKKLYQEKRAIYKELKAISNLKSEINPMGFVKSETTSQKQSSKQNSELNDDAIEIDMDL